MTLVPAVQAAVTQVDRDQAAHDFQTMEARVRSSPSVTNSRFFASLFTIFGSLAIVLAMVGVYGVMSWVVGQRTQAVGEGGRHPGTMVAAAKVQQRGEVRMALLLRQQTHHDVSRNLVILHQGVCDRAGFPHSG